MTNLLQFLQFLALVIDNFSQAIPSSLAPLVPFVRSWRFGFEVAGEMFPELEALYEGGLRSGESVEFLKACLDLKSQDLLSAISCYSASPSFSRFIDVWYVNCPLLHIRRMPSFRGTTNCLPVSVFLKCSSDSRDFESTWKFEPLVGVGSWHANPGFLSRIVPACC